MQRREFFTLLVGAATVPMFPPRAGQAQQADRICRIALLFPLGESDPEQKSAPRRHARGPAATRLVRRRDVTIEWRYAAGDANWFAPLAKEIVALKPDVIFVQSTGFAAAVHRDPTIPVVFTNVSDPWAAASLQVCRGREEISRESLCSIAALPAGKWLGMLKEIAPQL